MAGIQHVISLGLVASSLWFLWPFLLVGVLVPYWFVTGVESGGVDFTIDGLYNLIVMRILPGMALLVVGGIYVLKISGGRA